MTFKVEVLVFTALVCEVRLQVIEVFNPGSYATFLPPPVKSCLPENPVTPAFLQSIPQSLSYQPEVYIQSSTIVDVDATTSLPFQSFSPFSFPPVQPPTVTVPPPSPPIFNPPPVNIFPPSISSSPPPSVILPPPEQFPPSLSFPVPKPIPQPINFPSPPITVQPSQINLPQIPALMQPPINILPPALPLPTPPPVNVYPSTSVFPPPSIPLLPPQPISVPSLPSSPNLLPPIFSPPPVAIPTLLPSPTATLPPVVTSTPLVSTTVVNNPLTNTLASILQLILASKLGGTQKLYQSNNIASLYNVIGSIGTSNVYSPLQYPQNVKYPQYYDCYGYDDVTVAAPVNYGYLEPMISPPTQEFYPSAYGVTEFPVVGVADSNNMPLYAGYYLSYD